MADTTTTHSVLAVTETLKAAFPVFGAAWAERLAREEVAKAERGRHDRAITRGHLQPANEEE